MKKTETEIRIDAWTQVQVILADAVRMGLNIPTLQFIELAIIGLKAAEIGKGEKK